ncbi:MAG: IMP cyclohydrolase [Bacillota bacterium]
MQALSIHEALGANPYPGRGILFGRSPSGQAVAAYFIMGRSQNSRNRLFVPDGEGLLTEIHDPAKLEDPSLILYAPVKMFHRTLIVTNGDQTDTIFDALKHGRSFESALRSRCFEPDAPNYTPRISGILEFGGGFSYRLSILKADERQCCERQFYEYELPQPGVGHLIHTYRSDGQPLPPFDGEPKRVALPDGLDSIAEELWESLAEDNRISLFVREIDPKTLSAQTRIINRFTR